MSEIIHYIPFNEIDASGRLRDPDMAVVETLAASIKEQGLLHPIVVRPISENLYKLVIGGHRYLALIKAGLKQDMPCLLRDLTDDQALIAELDENIERAELSPYDFAKFHAARKDVYNRIHPETTRGGDRISDEAKTKAENVGFGSYADDVAGKLKVHKSTIEKAIATYNRISPAAREHIEASEYRYKGGELTVLSKMEPKHQAECAKLIFEEKAVSLSEANAKRTGIADVPKHPDDEWFRKITALYAQGKPKWRKAFLESVERK